MNVADWEFVRSDSLRLSEGRQLARVRRQLRDSFFSFSFSFFLGFVFLPDAAASKETSQKAGDDAWKSKREQKQTRGTAVLPRHRRWLRRYSLTIINGLAFGYQPFSTILFPQDLPILGYNKRKRQENALLRPRQRRKL